MELYIGLFALADSSSLFPQFEDVIRSHLLGMYEEFPTRRRVVLLCSQQQQSTRSEESTNKLRSNVGAKKKPSVEGGLLCLRCEKCLNKLSQ